MKVYSFVTGKAIGCGRNCQIMLHERGTVMITFKFYIWCMICFPICTFCNDILTMVFRSTLEQNWLTLDYHTEISPACAKFLISSCTSVLPYFVFKREPKWLQRRIVPLNSLLNFTISHSTLLEPLLPGALVTKSNFSYTKGFFI